MTRTAIVLLTRDLRVHDQPALAAACAAFDRVVPRRAQRQECRASTRSSTRSCSASRAVAYAKT